MAIIEEVLEAQRRIEAKLANLEPRLAAVEGWQRRLDEGCAQLMKNLDEDQARLQREKGGWRPIPGTMPATSQLDRLISTTATSLLSCPKAMRDRLWSLGCGMGHAIGCSRRRWSITLAACPIASEPGRECLAVPAPEPA